jgi:hypothetical protein
MPTDNVLVVLTTDVGPEAIVDLPDLNAARVRVIAPLTQLSRLQWLANDDDAERSAAARRAGHVAGEVEAETAPVVSTADDVLLAIEDALGDFDAHEIVIVTSLDGDASGLEEGAAWKAVVAFDVPVERIVV